jgi:hypothetical protein
VTDSRLTDELAERVFSWRLAPNRYLKPGRSWTPRARFQPLHDVRDAFRLLKALTNHSAVIRVEGETFIAEVRLGGQIGKAVGKSEARTLCLALAMALGIDAEASR